MGRVMEIAKGTAAVTGGRVGVRLFQAYVAPKIPVPASLGMAGSVLLQGAAAVLLGVAAGATLGHDLGADVMKGALSEPIVEGLARIAPAAVAAPIAAYPMAAYPLAAYPQQRFLGAGAPAGAPAAAFVDVDDDDD